MMVRTYSIAGALVIAMTVGMAGTLSGCAEETTAAVDEQDVQTLRFSVKGMTCEGCSSSVHNAIARLDGVVSCDVSLAGETATVQVSDVDASQRIVDVIAGLNFTIEPVPEQTTE